jgi:hypothetical protein
MSEPAFPSVNGTWGNDGMSLRDYFAGKALTGLVLGNDYGNSSDADIAKGAYEYADAMLEARNLKYND